MKHRDTPSSSGKSNGSSAETTKLNTEKNSGRTRNRILQSLHSDDENTLPKPVLQKQTLDGDDGVWNSPLVEKKNSWKLWNNNKENSSQPLHDDLVCRRALSAMKRSEKLSACLHEELFEKENLMSPWHSKHRHKYQLNSTAVANSGSSSSSSLSLSSMKRPDFGKLSAMDDVFEDATRNADSGVSSMDWASEFNPATTKSRIGEVKSMSDIPMTPKNQLKSFSISPVMNLKQLNLRSGGTPWSQKKCGGRSPYVYRSTQYLNRSVTSPSPLTVRATPSGNRSFVYERSHSWPSKCGAYPLQRTLASARFSSLISPPSKFSAAASVVPRSRVSPQTKLNAFAWKSIKEDQSMFKSIGVASSYNEFLPSPLK